MAITKKDIELIENKIKEVAEITYNPYDIEIDCDIDIVLYIRIEDGDWKHDHGFVKYIMREFFPNFTYMGNKDYVGSDGDWYTATHIFIKCGETTTIS